MTKWYLYITSVHRLSDPPNTLVVCGFASTESHHVVAAFAQKEAELFCLSDQLSMVKALEVSVGQLVGVSAPVIGRQLVRCRIVEAAGPNSFRVKLLDFASPLTGEPIELGGVPVEGIRLMEGELLAFADGAPAMGRAFRVRTATLPATALAHLLPGCLVEASLVTDEEVAENGDATSSRCGPQSCASLPEAKICQLTAKSAGGGGGTESDPISSPRHRHSGNRHWNGCEWSNAPFHGPDEEAAALVAMGCSQLREYIIHCDCLAGRELALKALEARIRVGDV